MAADQIEYGAPDDDDDTDDLLSNLSVTATATPQEKPSFVPKRKSQFFFTLTPALVLETEARKKVLEAKKLVHVDADLVKRAKNYRKELPPDLSANLDEIREFFLQELAPLTLAVQPGSAQALEIVERTIKGAIDPGFILQFERMLVKGVNMKMSRFIAAYLKLPPSAAKVLLESISPIRKEAVFIGADAPRPEHQPQRGKPEGEYNGGKGQN